MADFLRKLPKIELHAHINGSISENTMLKLLKGKDIGHKVSELNFEKGKIATLEDCFKKFKMVHTVSDNVDAVYMVTYDVIHDFAVENVKYLELRSTPREITATGLTKELYIQTVLKAIEDCRSENLDIVVKFLLSIDRRLGVKVAEETVKLADKYRKISNNILIGIDLSGDPVVGDARDFIPVLKEARELGLKLALHLAEVPAPEETMALLQILPDRIGHGTCIQPELGGTTEMVDFVLKNKLPLELCLTSNVVGQSVPNYDSHHFQFWYDKGHPCVICTDDKGVFNTSLSEEYRIAMETFQLSQQALYDLSYRSIDFIFSDETTKNVLRRKWSDIKETLTKDLKI